MAPLIALATSLWLKAVVFTVRHSLWPASRDCQQRTAQSKCAINIEERVARGKTPTAGSPEAHHRGYR